MALTGGRSICRRIRNLRAVHEPAGHGPSIPDGPLLKRPPRLEVVWRVRLPWRRADLARRLLLYWVHILVKSAGSVAAPAVGVSNGVIGTTSQTTRRCPLRRLSQPGGAGAS